MKEIILALIQAIIEALPYIIIGVIIIACITWIVKKFDNIDTGIKLIAKNLQILTQNQKTYFEEQMKTEITPENVKDRIEFHDKEES